MSKQLKQKLAQGEAVVGTWVSLSDPAVVEVLCDTGFDFLLVDGEHSPIGEDALKLMLMAAKGTGTDIIYRVRRNSDPLIKVALDLGVHGIMVPMINSAMDAKSAVNSTRYPPLGTRGLGPWRASNYYQNYTDYIATANDTHTLILQIENKDALPNLDEILAVDGFDAAFIGPADLSASMGLLGGSLHPDVIETIKGVAKTCRKANIPVGIDGSNKDHIAQMRSFGIQIFTYGLDVSYLADNARATAQEARAAL